MTNGRKLLETAVESGTGISYNDCVSLGMDPNLPFQKDFSEKFLEFLSEEIKEGTEDVKG